ncbi:hypothetical protein ACFYY1_37495 [Streptomyces sp. NPDC001890]|uniref:hypothetical protein n=1 Tax=Streptomyces sp. NPDC001890 TaxID=3364620 RepID=UPI0036BDA2C2
MIVSPPAIHRTAHSAAVSCSSTSSTISTSVHGVGAEAPDQTKYLSERIPATFVLAGVDVEGTGLFAGRRGGRIASRYSLILSRTSLRHRSPADPAGPER